MSKKKIATIWLDALLSCHMSFPDMDHRLLELADLIELVHSPLVDHKGFPPEVDVTLVEGAVSSDEELREDPQGARGTKILVAMGDCAVSANVLDAQSLRAAGARRGDLPGADCGALAQVPHDAVPKLLPRVRPVHEVVKRML